MSLRIFDQQRHHPFVDAPFGLEGEQAVVAYAGGVLFGTAGLKILSSKEAKTVYAHTTAAILRAKDCVMQTVTTIREGADDIYADAKSINDRRAAEAEAETIEDASADAE